MPTPAHKERSDYVAGLCLTGLLVGVMAVILGTMGAKDSEKQGPQYTVSVPVEAGVAGINTSSSLIYGGLVVGQVTDVEFKDNMMLVKVSLDRRLNLHSNVRIVKESSLLGGTTNLLIIDLGVKTSRSKQLKNGEVIPISKSGSGLTGVLGKGSAEAIDDITDNFAKSADGLRGIVNSIRSNDDITSIQTNYAALASDIQNDMPQWEASYQAILNRVESIQSKGNGWYEKLDDVTASAEKVEKSFTEITYQFREEQVEKLEKAIAEMVSATKEAAAQFETSVIPQADALVATARKSWNDYLALYSHAKVVAHEIKSSIDYALAQTTLASQQLTLTIDEVIGSLGVPLLQRPSQQEVELMAQYGAMSEWSRSAVQMQEILSALKNMPELTKSGDLEEQATMMRLIDLLRASLADYEAAQNKFNQINKIKNTGSSRRDGVDQPDQ